MTKAEAAILVAEAADRVDRHEDFGSASMCPDCTPREPEDHKAAWDALGEALRVWREAK